MINIDALNDDEKLAALESIHKSIAESKEIQKKKITTNVELIVKALKKIESDLKQRYDETGQLIANLKNGEDGRDGKDGKDGKNGRDGRDGPVGPRGYDGLPGRNGIDGTDGVSVTDAHIDFDGSLIISLSSGRVINVGEVVAADIAEKIKVITNGGGTSQSVLDAIASLQAQIDSIASGLEYQGTWNASTNVPTLASSVGTAGYYYIVATAGSTNLNGVTDWQVGDWAVFNGTVWQKIDQTNLVTSVAGRTGAITLTTADIGGLGTIATQNASNVSITGGSITGITDLAIADGGTGQSTAAAAITALTGTQTSGYYLRSNGTSASLSAISAGDVPTLNQNTTGTAAGLSATLATSSGGTGLTSFTADGVPYATSTSVLATSGLLKFQATNSALTVAATTTSNGYVGFTNSADGGTQGYIGDAKALITPGINSALAVRGEDAILFGIASTEGMRLNSTGLGIGKTAGSALDVKGTLRLSGSTSGYVGLAPAAAAGSTTYTLPSADGTANQALVTNGSGTLSWASTAVGTVTSVAASVPTFLSISGSPITSSGTIAITLSGTALPVANGGTGITSFGTGVATFLGTPSSANLAAAVTDETGSGALVFATSPTLVTPALGTPSSATLTNATGLPISTGVSGLGTGVATALAVNVGSAGAPVVNGGALGTPSSGTVTNLTGTASININGTVGATTPASGAFTTLSASSTVTLSGGTANGVAYLNGSKVLTSGSALTFDGTRLTSTTGKFGGGAASNSASLMVNNATNTATGIQLFQDGIESWIMGMPANSAGLAWSASGSEQMRLTSTGLGIGTSSPTKKLDIRGTNAGELTLIQINNDSITGTPTIATMEFACLGSAKASIAAAVYADGYMAFRTNNNTEKMRLDASGNLGVGTTSMGTTRLVIRGDATTNFAVAKWSHSSNASSGFDIGYASSVASNDVSIWNYENGFIRFATNNTERARIDSSGNFGIGTSSPASQLDVSKTGDAIVSLTSAGVQRYQLITRSGGNFEVYDQSSAASRLTLTQSGNLGLGVTPSAWGSSYKALQFPSGTYGGGSFITDGGSPAITANAYNNAGWKYVGSDYATIYQSRSGQHQWFTAPSGTAGNTITFTQAMTLDASGRLGIGTTNPAYKLDILVAAAGTALHATDGTNADFYVDFPSQQITRLTSEFGTNGQFVFANGVGKVERARIDSSGNLLVGTTSNAPAGTQSQFVNHWSGGSKWGISLNQTVSTSTQYTHINFSTNGTTVGYINANNSVTTYNSVSDYRLKTVIGAVSGSGERIDALEPIEYEWKTDGSRTRGFLAHKFQEVYANSVSGTKDAVDEQGNPIYQAMQAGSAEVIADLIAEIQSLRKRLADAGL